jgi:hypothetical protein
MVLSKVGLFIPDPCGLLQIVGRLPDVGQPIPVLYRLTICNRSFMAQVSFHGKVTPPCLIGYLLPMCLVKV